MPLKNLLLHLRNSPAMQQNSFLHLTLLPLISSPFLPLFYLFSFAYLTEAIVMSADLCRADMSAELLSYVVILIGTVFVSLHYPISEDGVTASSSALVLPTLVVLMGQQLQNTQAVQPHLSDNPWCRDFAFRTTTTTTKKQQRMVFMVQEEFLLEYMHRFWYTLCLSKWAKEGAQFAESKINCSAFQQKQINALI